MAHIVIMGAGVGGLPCAFEMKETLGKNTKLRLLMKERLFNLRPRTRGLLLAGAQKRKFQYLLKKH